MLGARNKGVACNGAMALVEVPTGSKCPSGRGCWPCHAAPGFRTAVWVVRCAPMALATSAFLAAPALPPPPPQPPPSPPPDPEGARRDRGRLPDDGQRHLRCRAKGGDVAIGQPVGVVLAAVLDLEV